jgi:ribonuclease HI
MGIYSWLWRNVRVKIGSKFVVSEKGLGSCDAYAAELSCVCEGLKLARARGFNRVELHVDSCVVATTLFLENGNGNRLEFIATN